jgi:predicted TIM-barrel fold metal-dependent hydrolase
VIIDFDSHVTVARGFERTPFRVTVKPEGQIVEFNGEHFNFCTPTGQWTRPNRPPIRAQAAVDLNMRLEDLDIEGIDRQLLIFHTSQVFYGAKPQIATAMASRFNDGLADMIATCRQPKRYLGTIHVALQDPDAAAREVERAHRKLSMPAVVIGTNVSGESIDLPQFWPFFEAINDLNIPVIVHSDGLTPFQKGMVGADRLRFRGGPFVFGDQCLWWMLGHGFEHMVTIARLVYSGLLDTFPNLKFIFEEANVGYAIYLFDRLEEGWWFMEQFGQGTRIHTTERKPIEYLERFHWGVEPEDSLLREVIRRWGADRILYTSDYPHGDTPWPDSVKEMREVLEPFSEEDRQKVFSGNAERLLNIAAE